jgi:hypothetical protein
MDDLDPEFVSMNFNPELFSHKIVDYMKDSITFFESCVEHILAYPDSNKKKETLEYINGQLVLTMLSNPVLRLDAIKKFYYLREKGIKTNVSFRDIWDYIKKTKIVYKCLKWFICSGFIINNPEEEYDKVFGWILRGNEDNLSSLSLLTLYNKNIKLSLDTINVVKTELIYNLKYKSELTRDYGERTKSWAKHLKNLDMIRNKLKFFEKIILFFNGNIFDCISLATNFDDLWFLMTDLPTPSDEIPPKIFDHIDPEEEDYDDNKSTYSDEAEEFFDDYSVNLFKENFDELVFLFKGHWVKVNYQRSLYRTVFEDIKVRSSPEAPVLEILRGGLDLLYSNTNIDLLLKIIQNIESYI